MTAPLLVFRIGYMESYDGIGKIRGGGAFVEENGEGSEMWNFLGEDGRCYGYVKTPNDEGLDLSRISKGQWAPGRRLPGVDIVFIARKERFGQVVVGWYHDATVFHKRVLEREAKQVDEGWDLIYYVCQVKAENARLLSVPQRNLRVPPPGTKGYPGQSNVWYGDDSIPERRNFILQLRDYISANGVIEAPAERKGIVRSTKYGPDKDLNLQVERIAIEKTWKTFEKAGYEVKSVEPDNRGWDLEASKDGVIFRLEVKGHAGNVIQFELTPNEYTQMKKYHKSFRVCVVRNALSRPRLKVFRPEPLNGQWILRDKRGTERIRLLERIAARAIQDTV
jgi:hypothetical protein